MANKRRIKKCGVVVKYVNESYAQVELREGAKGTGKLIWEEKHWRWIPGRNNCDLFSVARQHGREIVSIRPQRLKRGRPSRS